MAGGGAVGAAVNLLSCSVWVATQPVDMRTGIDGLSLRVKQVLGRAPCDGTAYVCSNRRQNWPFAGSERAGRRAAAMKSLFATAKLNGLDPAR
jgi:transposase